MPVAIAAFGGLLIGSFLNVVAWRLPRGESLSKPGSHCPGCGAPVGPYDNIPVLSWLALRARCRNCRTRISARYPIVEALTAGLYAAVAVARHDAAGIALGIVLVSVLVPVALIDLEHRIIPNKITLPAAIAALAIGLGLDRDFVAEQLIAGAAAGGFFLAAALAYPRGMGIGDVKLAAVMGLFLGRAVGPAILVALIAGVLVSIVVIARLGARAGRKTAVPFGPFLALGGIVGLFAGDAIANAYAGTF